MKPQNYIGKNEWKFAPATPPLHFHSFNRKKKKMYNFEFKLRSHYTQKGILPSILIHRGIECSVLIQSILIV